MANITQNTNRHYQEIGKKLIEKIEIGQFRKGERLPAERIIAEELNVSRAVVREAVIMLEIMGLIEVRKGSGIYITALPDEKENRLPDHSGGAEHYDVGPFELLQARQSIESRVAELAAVQVTKQDILKLKEAIDMERKQLEGKPTKYDGDLMFHQVIAEATQNSVLADVVKQLWKARERSRMWQRLHERIVNEDYRALWLEDHETIFTYLRKKEPKGAGRAMWLHLEHVKTILMELSDVDDPEFDGFLFDTSSLIDKT